MSKSFKALFKVGLSQSFDFRRKDKVKNASILVPVVLIFILGSLFSSFYSFIFCDALYSTGYQQSLNLVLYAMAGIASLLALVTGITKVKGTLFGGNDYDMLASLPIPKKNIIFVKFISLYLVQLFYTIIFVLPATIIVTIMGKQPLWLFDGVLLLIFSPVLPLLLAGILGTAISFISDRFRFGNIITVLIYIAFLGAIMYSSFMLNSGGSEGEYDVSGILQLLNIAGWVNPSTKLLSLNIAVLPYVFYVVSNGVVLLGVILLFAQCYDYFHFLMTATKSHQKYVERSVRPKGQFKALFVLDLKRYFTSKMYLMNTITSGVMSVLCIVIMIITFQSIEDPEAVSILKMIIPYFVLIVVWCVGMAVPSGVAINFEGKTMGQVKALPISYKQYSTSKILLSYLVLAPFILISSIVLTIFTEKNFINIFTIFVLPQVYLFGMSSIAYFINMHFYKLNWSNETEAVKNSAGMLISMLIDFIYTGLLCAVLIVPGVNGYFYVGAILTIVLVLAVTITFFLLVQKTCTKAITKIEA